jgi:hypothetical protein
MMFVSSVIRKSLIEGSGMIKKSVIWFLVLAFLSFGLVSDYAFASGDYGTPSNGEAAAIVIGTVVVLALIVFGVSSLARKTNAPGEQPQEQKEKDPAKSLNSQQPDEQPLGPSGQLAVLSW